MAQEAAADVGVGVEVCSESVDGEGVGAEEASEMGVVVAGAEVGGTDLDVLFLSCELVGLAGVVPACGPVVALVVDVLATAATSIARPDEGVGVVPRVNRTLSTSRFGYFAAARSSRNSVHRTSNALSPSNPQPPKIRSPLLQCTLGVS